MRRLRHRLPPAGQRRRAPRPRAPARDLEQNTIATSTVLEAMRAARRRADRLRVDRLGLRRARGLPDARGRARSRVQTSLYAASKLAGEGHDPGLRAGLRLHRARLPLRLGARRALHPRARVRLLPRAARGPDAPARARRRPPGEVVPLRRGLRLGDRSRRSPRTRRTPGSRVYNLGTDETVVRRRLGRDDRRAPRRRRRRIEYTGGTRGWIGDSPLIHLDCARMRALGWRPTLDDRARRSRARSTGSSATRGSSTTRGRRDERHLHAGAAAHLASAAAAPTCPRTTASTAASWSRGAIDKYVYMLTHTVFQRRYRLKYSEFEEVDDPREIRHPILRETLLRHWDGNPLEIASVADIPAGTGLGSSGAFTVCLLKALAPGASRWRSRRRDSPRQRLRDRDRRPRRAGRQAGPVRRRPRRHLRVHLQRDDSVDVEPLRSSAETLRAAARQPPALLHRRDAQRVRRSSRDQDRAHARPATTRWSPTSHRTKEIGLREPATCSSAATSSSTRELMHEHWVNKRGRSPGHGDRAHRRPLQAGPARAARSAASSSAPAAAASCSSTRAGRSTRARRWPPPARRRCASASTSRAASARSTGESTLLRVGIVGLRPRSGASAPRRSASDRLVGCFDVVPRSGRASLAAELGAAAVRVDSTSCSTHEPDVVIVATSRTTRSPTLAVPGARRGRPRPGREAGRARRRRGSSALARRPRPGGRLSRSASTTASIPAIARAVGGGAVRASTASSCTCAPATATAGASATTASGGPTPRSRAAAS